MGLSGDGSWNVWVRWNVCEWCEIDMHVTGAGRWIGRMNRQNLGSQDTDLYTSEIPSIIKSNVTTVLSKEHE